MLKLRQSTIHGGGEQAQNASKQNPSDTDQNVFCVADTSLFFSGDGEVQKSLTESDNTQLMEEYQFKVNLEKYPLYL